VYEHTYIAYEQMKHIKHIKIFTLLTKNLSRNYYKYINKMCNVQIRCYVKVKI